MRRNTGLVGNAFFSILLGILLLITGAGSPAAQEKTEGDKVGEPRIEVDNEVYSFGEVYRGTLLDHTFKIKNAGDADLVISNVDRDCGCTIFKLPKDILAPGEEAEINVKVNTLSQEGEIDKKVTLTTNDRLEPETILSITGKVLRIAAIEPSKIRLRDIRPGEEIPEQIVRIIPEKGYDVKVQSVISNNPNISARLVGSDEKEIRIGVKISSNTDKSFVMGNVRAMTNREEEPVLRIPVKVSIHQPYILSPRRLSFTDIPVDIEEPLGYSIVIQNKETEPLKILDVKNRSEFIEFTLTTLEAGMKYKLNVKLLPGFPEESFEDIITLYTNNTMYPEMDVPIQVRRLDVGEVEPEAEE